MPDAEAATTVKVQVPIKAPEVLVSPSTIREPEYAVKVAVLPAAPLIENTPDITGVFWALAAALAATKAFKVASLYTDAEV